MRPRSQFRSTKSAISKGNYYRNPSGIPRHMSTTLFDSQRPLCMLPRLPESSSVVKYVSAEHNGRNPRLVGMSKPDGFDAPPSTTSIPSTTSMMFQA
jgi:hypothetical protein